MLEPLQTITYESRARPDLADNDIFAIYKSATDLNALDGVTGLLAYNGVAFAQLIEGTANALGDLFERLQADTRHSMIVVKDRRQIQHRSFADWSMKLVELTAPICAAWRTSKHRSTRSFSPTSGPCC